VKPVQENEQSLLSFLPNKVSSLLTRLPQDFEIADNEKEPSMGFLGIGQTRTEDDQIRSVKRAAGSGPKRR
jgi:hypothetical protein